MAENFEFKVLVEPQEPDVAISAEDCHKRHMATLFEAALEIMVGSGGMCRLRPVAGMAVEVRQELVAKLFELDEQIVHRRHISYNPQASASLVRKFSALIEHVDALDLRAGNEKELLLGIGGQLSPAIMEKQ